MPEQPKRRVTFRGEEEEDAEDEAREDSPTPAEQQDEPDAAGEMDLEEEGVVGLQTRMTGVRVA